MPYTAKQIRERAEKDLYFFACLVHPSRVYGTLHKKLFRFLQRNEKDQLALLPRGHQKSQCIATWAAWWITKHPETTIVYLSATEDLATQQLYSIKAILEGEIHRRYWPDMIVSDESKREEWNFKNIKVDHPLRKELGVRDRTVAARSVGSNTTGLHADVLIFDDLVVPDNAYTEEGRRKVNAAYSQFSSVLNTGGITKAVGTRYHGRDIYATMLDAEVEHVTSEGEITGSHKMYEVMQEAVEDGGIYLWPRERHPKTGRWYGFNPQELAKIRAKYFAAGERAQFYGQYYNSPDDPDSEKIGSEHFQYYDRKFLTEKDGTWYIKDKALALFAGGDLAFTDNSTSDYTAFSVIGLDSAGYVYILELDMFRTTKYERMYSTIERLHRKWGFRKVRIETNAGANLAVEYMKDRIREEGLMLTIEGKAARKEKTERHQMILEPRYENGSVFHYKGGLITTYEEQLILTRPSHDDLLDATSIALEISKVPKKRRGDSDMSRGKVISIDSRFGGRIR